MLTRGCATACGSRNEQRKLASSKLSKSATRAIPSHLTRNAHRWGRCHGCENMQAAVCSSYPRLQTCCVQCSNSALAAHKAVCVHNDSTNRPANGQHIPQRVLERRSMRIHENSPVAMSVPAGCSRRRAVIHVLCIKYSCDHTFMKKHACAAGGWRHRWRWRAACGMHCAADIGDLWFACCVGTTPSRLCRQY